VLQKPHRYGNSRAILDYTDTVLPATRQRWHSRLYPQLIKASTRFSDSRGMQGWVDLVGLVTYQLRARRRSPIPVLTGLNVEQLRSCDERRYHSAKPPRWWWWWCMHRGAARCSTRHLIRCEHLETRTSTVDGCVSRERTLKTETTDSADSRKFWLLM